MCFQPTDTASTWASSERPGKTRGETIAPLPVRDILQNSGRGGGDDVNDVEEAFFLFSVLTKMSLNPP